MQFQQPTFLWALGFLAIPILIHLFNLRRYKTVYFSDIRFLKDVQQSTKKQRKLKEWLVLVARLIALAAIVFAFAKPFLPSSEQENVQDKVVIILDNSPSTSVGVGPTSPFERAKKLALSLIDALPQTSEIGLITSNSTSLKKYTKTALVQELKTLTTSDRNLNVLPGQDFSNTSVYFISDLQKNNMPILSGQKVSGNWIVLPTITDDEQHIDNVCIDSVWVDSPFLLAGQPVDFFVRLKNYGAQKSEINIELLTNNLPEINVAAQLEANSDTTIKTVLTQLKSGFNTLKINILNEAVIFDNNYSLSYFLPASNNVVEIYQTQPNSLIKKIFTGDEFSFQAMPASAVNNELLANADLIIINSLEEISSGLASSLISHADHANIFLIPSAKNPEKLNSFCTQIGAKNYGKLDTAKLETQKINTTDPFFQEVFAGSTQDAYWPTVNKHYKFVGNTTRPTFNLMTLVNGDPLFLRLSNKSVNIFQLAIPLDETFSNIVTHPVVVPLFIKALVKKDNISSFTGEIGIDARFDIKTIDNTSETPISLTGYDVDFIPRQQKRGNITSIVAGADLQRAGNYKLQLNEKTLGTISFNTSKSESDLQRFSVGELKTIISNRNLDNVSILEANAATLKTVLIELQQGIQLWKYCLLIALIFVLLEVILLRFLK